MPAPQKRHLFLRYIVTTLGVDDVEWRRQKKRKCDHWLSTPPARRPSGCDNTSSRNWCDEAVFRAAREVLHAETARANKDKKRKDSKRDLDAKTKTRARQHELRHDATTTSVLRQIVASASAVGTSAVGTFGGGGGGTLDIAQAHKHRQRIMPLFLSVSASAVGLLPSGIHGEPTVCTDAHRALIASARAAAHAQQRMPPSPDALLP